MMDQLVSVETAKLAEAQGFNVRQERCIVQLADGRQVEMWTDALSEDLNSLCYLPTQTTLQKWLREEHNIQVTSSSHTLKSTIFLKKARWTHFIACVNNHAINDARDEEFATYEGALEVGLQHALESIK